MSLRAMQKRVTGLALKHLGRDYPLNPHDCRHYWATQAARHGTNPLHAAGGRGLDLAGDAAPLHRQGRDCQRGVRVGLGGWLMRHWQNPYHEAQIT
jgi:hypothetical protein